MTRLTPLPASRTAMVRTELRLILLVPNRETLLTCLANHGRRPATSRISTGSRASVPLSGSRVQYGEGASHLVLAGLMPRPATARPPRKVSRVRIAARRALATRAAFRSVGTCRTKRFTGIVIAFFRIARSR
jgi:hypothetical protein